MAGSLHMAPKGASCREAGRPGGSAPGSAGKGLIPLSPDREAPRTDGAGDSIAPAVASREDDLLNAWDRLLAIAALYPAQNTRFHDAVAEWRHALRPVARADGSFCIEVGREDRLAHEGHVQPTERVARCRLYPLLMGIGVEHIVLSIDIADEALHRLLALLREARRAADRSIGFQHAELPELPAGVTVTLRSFGNPGETALGSVQPGSSGGEGGAPDGAASPGAPRSDVHNPHVGVQSDLARSLEDRLTAQATTLYRNLTRDAMPEATSETAVRETAAESPPERSVRKVDPALPLDAQRLHAQLAQLDTGARFDSTLLGPSQPEWVALLLQHALVNDAGATALSARRELATALERELGLQEIQIVVTACEGLLDAGDAEQADALLPLLLDPIAQQQKRLEPVLTALADGADAKRRELLWPHLADALLREAVSPSFAQVKGADGETALALPAEARSRVLGRLEAQPALQTGRIAPSIFRPLRAEMRPLLLVLLQSSRGSTVGGQLRAALLESPPPAPFAGVLALLGDFKPSQREFYRLLIADEAEAGLALGREAASLALQVLLRLPRGERRRPEVSDTLRALMAAPPGEAEALLASVLAERRLLFLPAWPAAARRQAQQIQRRRHRGRIQSAVGEEVGA